MKRITLRKSVGRAAILAAVLLVACRPGAATEITTGEKVTVIKWNAEFKTGSRVVGKAELGQNYIVDKINGDWLWIGTKQAYLKRTDVIHYDDAIGYFTDRIRKEPSSGDSYNDRATALEGRGELEVAMKDYNEAIRVNPTSAAYHSNRGICWEREKEFHRAIVDYNEAIRLDAKYAATYLKRSVALSAIGKFDGALADLNEYKRLKEESAVDQPAECFADIHNALAWVYGTCPDAKFRNGTLAIEHATRSCELSGWKNYNSLDTLAVGYAEAGDFPSAVRWQVEALKVAQEVHCEADSTVLLELRNHLELFKSGKAISRRSRRVGHKRSCRGALPVACIRGFRLSYCSEDLAVGRVPQGNFIP